MAFVQSAWQGGVDHLSGVTQRHSYRTADALATVDASGYFNTVAATLHKGDIIEVAGDAAGTPYAQQLVVTSADTVTPVTTLAAV